MSEMQSISDHTQKLKIFDMSETKFLSTLKNSVLDEPEICFADFSVHAQEPP